MTRRPKTVLEARKAKRMKEFLDKVNVEDVISHEEWLDIVDYCGGFCMRCLKHRRLTMDHVLTIDKGGTHTKENIQALCGPCNSSKGTQSTDYRDGFDERIIEARGKQNLKLNVDPTKNRPNKTGWDILPQKTRTE